MEEALIVWAMILAPRKWGLYNAWVEFARGSGSKAITRDTWQQLLEFATGTRSAVGFARFCNAGSAYPKDLSAYDASSSWPSLLDDFVDWCTKNKKP